MTPTLISAKLLPAEKILDSYFLTKNVNADYCIGTSKNVVEIADLSSKASQIDIYKKNNEYLTKKNEELENKPNYNIYWFIGGYVLATIIDKK